MPAAVLFELEGVIVETRALRAEALRHSLGEIGVALDDGLLGLDYTGLSPRERAIELLGERCAFADETELDLVALRAERAFIERVTAGVTLAPGARECIAALHDQLPLALVTRASRRVVEVALSLGGFQDAFECIVTSEDARTSKPSPALHELALSRLGRRQPIAPADCLALEDGTAGIRAAKRAGLRCIAVGDIPPGEAMGMAADAWLPSLEGQTAETLASLLRSGEENRR